MKAFLGFTQWYAVYVKGYAKMVAPLNDALKGMCITKAQKGAQKFEKKSGRLVGADGTTWTNDTLPAPDHPDYAAYCKAVGKICCTPKMIQNFELLVEAFS